MSDSKKNEFDVFMLKKDGDFKKRFRKLKEKTKYPLYVMYGEAFEEYLEKEGSK